MQALFNRFVREDAGQDLIEYGLLVGVISAATVGFLTKVGPKVQGYYSALCTAMGAC